MKKSLESKIRCIPQHTHTHTPGLIRQSLDVVFEMLVIVSLIKHFILKTEKCINILNDIILQTCGEFNNVSARARARLLIPCFTLFASKKVPVNGRSPERSRC